VFYQSDQPLSNGDSIEKSISPFKTEITAEQGAISDYIIILSMDSKIVVMCKSRTACNRLAVRGDLHEAFERRLQFNFLPVSRRFNAGIFIVFSINGGYSLLAEELGLTLDVERNDTNSTNLLKMQLPWRLSDS
jgi:hypothetical protein